jgi:hypothetical protein
VHVGGDVALDERTPTGRGVLVARHLLQQQASGRFQRPEQDADVRAVLALADVLAHLDRADRVKGLTGLAELAVVLETDVDPVGQTAVGHPLDDEVALLGRERDPGDVDAVVLGRVQRQRTPPAADVEHPHAGFEAELAADQVELGPLRVGE